MACKLEKRFRKFKLNNYLLDKILSPSEVQIYEVLHELGKTILYNKLLEINDPNYEVWVPAKVWTFKYQKKGLLNLDGVYVSNLGRIFNLYSGTYTKGVKKSKAKDSYLRVKFDNSNYLIHRIVATCFLPNKTKKAYIHLTVNHKSGIKCENGWDNLEWVTVKDNLVHACSTGLKNNTLGHKNHQSYIFLGTVVEQGPYLNEQFIISGETQQKEYKCLGAIKVAKGLRSTSNRCKFELIGLSDVKEELLIQNKTVQFQNYLKHN